MILVLNGPNLNLFGTREPEIYGYETLDDMADAAAEEAARLGAEIDFRQTNSEGELVTWIQKARGTAEAIVINAAAYTHTSIAIHDALRAFEGRVVELHVSNPHLREPFRHISYVAPAANALVAGFGPSGYPAAIRAALIDLPA